VRNHWTDRQILNASSTAYLITSVLAKFNAAYDLLVDQIGGNTIRLRIMPRSEDLFTEEQPPWSISLHCSLFLGILLAL